MIKNLINYLQALATCITNIIFSIDEIVKFLKG